MVEEKGIVNENLEAVLQVRLTNGATIECVLDTGFNGSLLLPREFVEINAMLFVGREKVMMVEEISTEIDTAIAEVNWLGRRIFHSYIYQRNRRIPNRNTNARQRAFRN